MTMGMIDEINVGHYGPGVSTIQKIVNNSDSDLVLWNSEAQGDNSITSAHSSRVQPGQYGTAIPAWSGADEDRQNSFYEHHLLIGTQYGIILMWQEISHMVYYKINSFPANNRDGVSIPAKGNNFTLSISNAGNSLNINLV